MYTIIIIQIELLQRIIIEEVDGLPAFLEEYG